MRRILVPPRPGAFSALGLLCTDVIHDYIKSELKPLPEISASHAQKIFAALEARACQELAEEGMALENLSCARELDLRYVGQGYELRVSLDGLAQKGVTAGTLVAARERFDERHAQIHGHAAPDRMVEVVSYRVRARVAVPKYKQGASVSSGAASTPKPKGERAVYFDAASPVQAILYERDGLDIGARVAGPAIVEQFDATTVIPPGWSGHVDVQRNLVLERTR
jgi:N-methylhydantoinase A